MSAPLVLAIDIGTSSVRASVYDGRLRATRTAQIKYRWREHTDGRVELDARQLETLVARAIDMALHGQRQPIAAVATAAFWHSLVGVDDDGGAVTAVLPWSDLRAAEEADALRHVVSERSVHTRTGCRLHASYWPARLRWFKKHDRRTFARVRRWVSFGEVLERRWLGRDGVSVSQASGTGLLVQDTCAWDARLLRACDVSPEQVAPMLELDDTAAELSGRLKRRWPALAGAIWLPAVGDGAVNNVGAGCVTRGRAALMIGTSGALRVLWEPSSRDRIRPRFGLWRYRLDRSRVVLGGALSNGGNVRDWMLRTLAATDDVLTRANAIRADSHGLTMLPFLAGTRSPDYLVRASGALTGLSIATRPEHLLRATMESVAYRFAQVFEEMQHSVRIRELIAAGGALERSPAWTQILADVLDRPIQMCGQRELTSRGAAALGFERLGGRRVEDLPAPRGRTVVPDRRRHQVYAAAMRRHRELMHRLYGVT